MSESTIVQNGALYLIQHTVPRPRSKTLDFARRFFSAHVFHREKSSWSWSLSRLMHLSGS